MVGGDGAKRRGAIMTRISRAFALVAMLMWQSSGVGAAQDAPLTRGGIIIMESDEKRAGASGADGGAPSCRLTFNIPFANGSAVVPAAAAAVLDKVAELLRAHPEIALTISGHTSAGGWRGLAPSVASDRNLSLSMDRAVAVRRRLLALGAGAARLKAEGRGDTEPEPGRDPSDTRNRRVVFERIGC